MWSLLRLGERKNAKMVAVHGPRWLSCPYMLKTFKTSSSPEPNKPWGLIFAQILGDRRSIKIAKMMIDLFTARSDLLPHAFVWVLYIYMGKIHILDISSIIQLNQNLMMSIRAVMRHKIAK